VIEVTQSLVVPCERPTFAHLRALHDLTTFPEAREKALSAAQIYFNFAEEVIYSGYARQRDRFDSPVLDAPDFTIQVWHGDKLFRTMQIGIGYVGILHVQVPEGGDPNDYFVKDPVGKKCRNLERPDLAPAVIGYDMFGRTMIDVPTLPRDHPYHCFA